jgi:FkbM family methyltransferase
MFSKKKNKQGSENLQFVKKSYSQCGEDLIVKFLFEAIGVSKPGYLDIGAHHPYEINNTALFYESGSTGINVEPNPDLIGNFIINRPKDINLNMGISANTGEMDYYMMNFPVLNTFSKESAENAMLDGKYSINKIVKVKTDTVDNVILNYANNKYPDFLSVDAEGIDEQIIRSIDFKNNYPLVICVETISFSEKGQGKKNSDLINFVVDNGYINYADTFINTIFVRKDRWIK